MIIVGGGIGGLATALALQLKGVRCVVYERDEHCDQRRGYGLTLSNPASLAALGLEEACRDVNSSCVSDCHWTFDEHGHVLGYFGIAFTGKLHERRGNLRVPRLVLRRLLYERLEPGTVQWGWRLRGYEEAADGRSVSAHFERPPSSDQAAVELAAEATTTTVQGSVLVGADGVHSVVRSLKFGDGHRYVGVVVVLGVCDLQHPLLHEQGFYTLDGTHRLFTMPYEPLPSDGVDGGDGMGPQSRHSTMWQISFTLEDEAAARTSGKQRRPGAAKRADAAVRALAHSRPRDASLHVGRERVGDGSAR